MSMFLGSAQPFFSERPEQTLIKKKFARAKAHILLEYTRLRLVRLALCSLLLRPRHAAVDIHGHRWISASEQSSHVRRRRAQREGAQMSAARGSSRRRCRIRQLAAPPPQLQATLRLHSTFERTRRALIDQLGRPPHRLAGISMLTR